MWAATWFGKRTFAFLNLVSGWIAFYSHWGRCRGNLLRAFRSLEEAKRADAHRDKEDTALPLFHFLLQAVTDPWLAFALCVCIHFIRSPLDSSCMNCVSGKTYVKTDLIELLYCRCWNVLFLGEAGQALLLTAV